jgi:predicted ATPase
LLKSLPDTPERIQQELDLQTTLGPVLMAAKGYAAPEVGQVYARARELCQQIGNTPQLGPVLHGLWGFYVVRTEHRTAYELEEQLLSLAESQQDTTCLIEAHWAMGATLFLFGELTAARAHVEQSLALYNLREHRSLAFVYGHDPGMSSLCFAALALWHLGYPDQALKSSQAAVSLAREVDHPFSLVYALNFTAWCHQFRREGQRAKEQAEAGIALSTEHGVPLFLAQSSIFHGRALAEQEQGEEGVAQICQGLATYRASGGECFRPYFLALLAEAYGRAGQVEEGLAVLAEALDIVNKTGERVGEAELYRLAGELTLRMGERETGRTGEEEKIAHSSIHPFLSRGVFPQSHRNRSKVASQIPRTPRYDEPGPAATTASDAGRITHNATRSTRDARRSTHNVIRGLPLVHRRV